MIAWEREAGSRGSVTREVSESRNKTECLSEITATDVRWTFNAGNAKLSRALDDLSLAVRHRNRFDRFSRRQCRHRTEKAELFDGLEAMQVDEEVRPCPWKSA